VSPEAHAIRQGWNEVLDELEADLAADHELIEKAIIPSNPTAWQPPQHLGAIPIELRERASRILGELGESSRQLNQLRIATGQQLNAVRSIPTARNDASVYLDVTG
jgi:hypothetical protein